MSKKDKTQNRDLRIKIRVNQAEMDLIKRKFRESGMQTFSGFIRTIDLFENIKSGVIYYTKHRLKRNE